MSSDVAFGRARRLTARQRDGESVSPLELFFDLVFVLGFTQCTALMADEPTWEGLAKGLLVLGVLWWSWVGYAWLTSVVDPEDDAVRLVIFAAMAALLVVGLAVPGAFEDSALIFACAYAFVRVMHIALFMLASREDAQLRSSVLGLAVSTALASGLLVGASFADGALQGALWALALGLDAVIVEWCISVSQTKECTTRAPPPAFRAERAPALPVRRSVQAGAAAGAPADTSPDRTLRTCVSCSCARYASATRPMPRLLMQSSPGSDSPSCWACGPASPGRPMSAATTQFATESTSHLIGCPRPSWSPRSTGRSWVVSRSVTHSTSSSRTSAGTSATAFAPHTGDAGTPARCSGRHLSSPAARASAEYS